MTTRRLRPTGVIPAFLADRKGVSATEFGLVAPVLALVLAGTLDIGASLFTRFGLNAAVSAGANYAIVNSASVTSTDSGSLADAISKLVASSQSSNWARGAATVNNGPTSVSNAGATSRTGSTSPADGCYCPTLSGSTLTWGASVSCGSACASGAVAGKFVLVSASRDYAPVLGGYSFAGGGTLSAQMLEQVQ